MTRVHFVRAWIALAPVLVGPRLAAQALPDEPAIIPQDSVQQAIQRFEALQERLTTVQQRALEASPGLQQEQEGIQRAIEAAMFEAHPDLKPALQGRIPELRAEVEVAQRDSDQVRLQLLANEYQAIQQRAEDAQAEVVEADGLKRRLGAFQRAVMAAMKRVDSEIETVYEDLRALGSRLERTLRG